MIKQSTAVIALLLASSNATKMSRKAPKSINLFATGMNGDEDLGQDIIMKGDKFHYQQNLSETAPAATTPVAVGPNGQPVQQAPIKKLVSVNARAREDPKVEEKKEEKKTEEKKEEKKAEEKKAEEKKEEKTEEKKEEADDEEEGEEKEFK